REPAAVIETSPKNYQAWVKVAANAPAEHRGAIARRLEGIETAQPRRYHRTALDEYRSEMAGLVKRFGDD
ncbi:DNA-primase RepB domain-containing protein, partial [Aeromonas caviae]|uniref:DNA-primase RepB domain-containing protein n=1 Tax=Aeromonas caviae TaxID=648 RepID=UPI001CC5918A